MVARFLRRGNTWSALPDRVAIQLNGTHPAMAVAELTHILPDRAGPRLFDPIRDALLDHGDHYLHLADLASYVADESRDSDAYADRGEWGRKPVLKVARSGKFSSDRTIAEYALSICGATPCPVAWPGPREAGEVS